MTQSFAQKRKMSINLYIIQLIYGIFALTTFIVLKFMGRMEFSQSYNSLALITLYIIMDILFVSALLHILIKKPYSVLIDFSPEGIRCQSKDIFMSWNDIESLKIRILGVESYFVISTNQGKLPFSTWLYGKLTPEHILVECRKELVPVIEQHWKEPIKKINKYRKKNNNSYLLLTIISSIPVIILLALVLLYILVLLLATLVS